ncbi:MAG: rhomboid family intramembrane serine protease [Firmicutes bacterium]|nr:rhomboid family intramembrane serine protease [Bacillota bacterium]
MANFNYYKNRFKQLTLTELLIGINVLMFLLTQVIDVISGNGLLVLGAKVNALIGLGEYWRLLGAMFLHADLMHLIFNMMALYLLGRDIERFFGKKKFLFIYFVSGLVGSAASYLLVDGFSVGASGAIFGLMGANLFLYKLNPMVYKRIYGYDFLILIGINLVLGLIRPNIDMAGHLGGLVGGFVAASAVRLNYEKWWNGKRFIYYALALVVIIVPTVFGTLKQQNNEDLYISGAYYYFTEGKIEKSMDVIEQGLKKYPNQADLLYMKDVLKNAPSE